MRSLMLLVAVACKAPAPEGPTFHADVVPVLDRHCMRCHDAGGIAPMAFDTFEGASQWGPAIVAATAARSMPPKQVLADGTCGEFVDEWWLTDEELAVFADWVAADMPEGDPVDRAAPAPLPTIEATHTIVTPEFAPIPVGDEYARYDEYRCFAMPLDDVPDDMYLTGFDVHPGNERIVHHVIGHIVDPTKASNFAGRTNAEQMAALDAESPDRLGWPCFFGAGDDVDFESDPMGWAPGQGATSFPDGHGVAVPAGSWIVAQVHYNMSDAATLGQTDTTELTLKLSPPSEITDPMFVLYIDFLLAYGDSLPAGDPEARYRRSITLNQLGVPFPVNIVGIMPHMHARGRELKAVVLRPDGERECMVDVPSWDYAWQFIYFYEDPFVIAPEDEFILTCVYDTTDTEEDVLAGWGTQNEMCLTVVYATL
jgi:hypothetical protein